MESVLEKPRSKAPPPALNTVELLRSASIRLHVGPKQTMDIAERLYTEVGLQTATNFPLLCASLFQGYISYPRTETTRYSPEFDFRSIIADLNRNPAFSSFTSPLLQRDIKVPR